MLSLPANSQAKQNESYDVTSVNNFDHLSALVRTDRDPRSIKTLFLLPGKERYFYYEIIRADGSTVTKIETVKLKHVPDKRALSDSHPNLYWIGWGGQTGGSLVGSIIGSGLIH